MKSCTKGTNSKRDIFSKNQSFLQNSFLCKLRKSILTKNMKTIVLRLEKISFVKKTELLIKLLLKLSAVPEVLLLQLESIITILIK